MLTVATCFWRPNRHSADFSRCYTEEWVNRLARGFRRNLSFDIRFVVLTDREYQFDDGVEQEPIGDDEPDWSSMIEPFRIEGPMIVAGLDTVVTGNCDALWNYCYTADRIALPRSPGKRYACNGICLVPSGQTGIYTRWGGQNDMDWLRLQDHGFIDDELPGQVVSYKCDVRPNGLGDARVVYFHGPPKMDALPDEPFVRNHWR